MSDWQVGDLAVCVDASQEPRIRSGEFGEGEYRRGMRFLVTGRSYNILQVVQHWSGKQGVYLAGQPVPAPYDANRFARVRPDEHEACETEFVTLLQRSKRKVGA